VLSGETPFQSNRRPPRLGGELSRTRRRDDSRRAGNRLDAPNRIALRCNITRTSTIDLSDTPAPAIHLGQAHHSLQPGSASLSMIIDGASSGSIAFHLEGPRFGMARRRPESDAVLWMRLGTLGHRLANAHRRAPHADAKT